MCNLWKKKEYYTYEKTECFRIIDEISELNIPHLIISGGEALLHDGIFEIIQYAKRKGIKKVSIVTNGTLLDEKNSSLIVNSGIDEITFSVDGLEESHDFLRGKGNFRKTIDSIMRLNKSELRKKMIVGITSLVHDKNCNELPELVKLAETLNCNFILFQPILPNSNDMKDRLYQNWIGVSKKNIETLEKNIQIILKMRREKKYKRLLSLINVDQMLGIKRYYEGTLKKARNKSIGCYEGYLRLVINENGKYFMCGGECGSVKDCSIKETWFSKQAESLRNTMKKCDKPCLQNCVLLSSIHASLADNQ